jgi:P27 family predicted phage terminase small subunit
MSALKANLRPVEPAAHPRPPRHLSPETKRWWRAVTEAFALEEHHLRLLQLACESWDRAQEARRAVQKDGLCVEGRFGPKSHPALAVERDSRTSFMRALRELGLDIAAPDDSRPPAMSGWGRQRSR